MIVKCSKCNTSFQVDDAILSPTGSKVRCSICQNIFTVVPVPIDQGVHVNEAGKEPSEFTQGNQKGQLSGSIDIFISYANKDRKKAETLAKVLEENGWKVWWDRNIPPGQIFSQVIEEVLEAAKCIVVLWSESSIVSHWVHNEAAEGADRRNLVPALIDDVKIPFEFRRIQAANLADWEPGIFHLEFDNFIDSIEKVIESF